MSHTPSQEQRNGEHVLYCYNDDSYTYGTIVNAEELCYDIVLEADKTVRLINPSSDPRVSWQRVRNHCHVDWGDGIITKWFSREINSGRFNRGSEFIPQHVYKNANVGDRFTIKIKCREPLAPIYCKVTSMYGVMPEDIYRVKSTREADDDMGLFGECYHLDYPELSLLNKHRGTIHTVGKDLLKKWRNTDMTNMFSYFIALREVPIGFFNGIMGNVLSYKNCFRGCDSLELVDEDLLGISNGKVQVLDYMFESCISLKNTIHLQNSGSLISVVGMYKDCWKLNVCDARLFGYCPNIKHADEIFMNDKALNTLGPNVLKFSLNMETLSSACENSGMTQTYISIGRMTKLYDARKMYYNCVKLATITDGFFKNTGINIDGSNKFNCDSIFENAGDRTSGCVVPSELCRPISKITKIVDIHNNWFYGFYWRGNSFPKDLFRDSFKTRNGIKFTVNEIIKNAYFPEVVSNKYDGIELVNPIYTGDQSGLETLNGAYSCIGNVDENTEDAIDRNKITYISRDSFASLADTKSLINAFEGTHIAFKFYEKILSNCINVNDFRYFFKNSYYEFSEFPIDYLVRTTSDESDIDMREMYSYTNIRTYRPIHWSATKNVRYYMNDIVREYKGDAPSVPVEFMLDGRTQVDKTYEHEYKPLGIEYLVNVVNVNNRIVTVTIGEGETRFNSAYIDWGDGTVETFIPNETNRTKDHAYAASGSYLIKIKSDRTAYFILSDDTNDKSQPFEIRGEFPYKSFDYLDEETLNRKFFYFTSYLGEKVFRIIHEDGSDTYMNHYRWFSEKYIHPHTLKYTNNATSLKIFDPSIFDDENSGNSIMDINSIMIPPKFYENAVNLSNFNYLLLSTGTMIPDNVFPEENFSTEAKSFKNMAGFTDIQKINHLYKLHMRTSLYKDYMLDGIENRKESDLFRTYPLLPYNTSWVGETTDGPLYEKLTFIVRNTTINGLGLERLAAGTIGEIRIEIFKDNEIVDKKVAINNDSDLVGVIGDLTGELNVINIYSRVPLWLTNKNIIEEVRGVIPECNLGYTFKALAPNVKRISETLFFRLTNKSFDNMFKDCTKLEHVPSTIFLNNTSATSFVSCFENCTSLFRVDDYIINSYENDIDCTNMFKGCTGIRYVFRPICTSVWGRVNVTDMFVGCNTLCHDLGSDLESQVFSGIYIKGNSGLSTIDSVANFKRSTNKLPRVFTYYDIENNNISDNAILALESSIYQGRFDKMIETSTISGNIENFARALTNTYGYNISKNRFISQDAFRILHKYMWKLNTAQISIHRNVGSSMFTDTNVMLDSELYFYNERLRGALCIYANQTAYFPIHSSFMKMNENLYNTIEFFDGTTFKHIDDTEKSSILGKDRLGDLRLGAKNITMDLPINFLFDRNIECLSDVRFMFNSISGNFIGDKLCLGNCSPSNMQGMFSNWDRVAWKSADYNRGYPITFYTLKNVWNNANISRFNTGNYEDATINFQMLFSGNRKINDDGSIFKKLTAFRLSNTLEAIGSVYTDSSLKNLIEDVFTNLDSSKPIGLQDIFSLTDITTLPKINHLVQLYNTWHLFYQCEALEGPIPENYIRSNYQSDEVDLNSMFAFTNLVVNNQFIDITSTATFNVQASLQNIYSTIGDDPEIFLGIKYNTDPAYRSLVKVKGIVKNAFEQIIYTDTDNVEVHIEYFGDHTTSLKEVNDMEIDWGDDSEYFKATGSVDFATLRHTYTNKGEFKVQIRCNEFPCYIETNDRNGEPVHTKYIGQFKVGDSSILSDGRGNQHALSDYFGINVEEVHPNIFDNLTGIESIEELHSTFFECKAMKTVPETVFSKMTSVTNLIQLFSSSGLTEIPAKIFESMENLEELMYIFNDTPITEIPEGIFDNNVNIHVIYHLASSCPNLSKIPLNIFSKMDHLYELYEPFTGENKLRVDDSWGVLLENNRFLSSVYGLFSRISIDSIPADIFKNQEFLELASYAFYNGNGRNIIGNAEDAENLVIPEGLFDGVLNLTTIESIFEGRKNIVSYPENLFKKNSILYNFYNAFRLTGITKIHKYTISDAQTSSSLSCNGMFDSVPIDDLSVEPISQSAKRTVTTSLMLNGIKGPVPEADLFVGVKTAGDIRSGYIWDTVPMYYNIKMYDDASFPETKLITCFEYQNETPESIYVDYINIQNNSNTANFIKVSPMKYMTPQELESYVVPSVKGTAGDYYGVYIHANRPLRPKFKDGVTHTYWCGLTFRMPELPNFDYEKVKMAKWVWGSGTTGEINPSELFGEYFGYNASKITTLNNFFSAGNAILFINSTFEGCENLTSIRYLLNEMTYNLITYFGKNNQYMPKFNKFKKLVDLSHALRLTKFIGGDGLPWRDITLDDVEGWEPFEGLKPTAFPYLYCNNLPRLFNIDFSNPDGVTTIASMFEGNHLVKTYLPYNYFDAMVRMCNNSERIFSMSYLLGNQMTLTTLKDADNGNKMFMSEWNPEIRNDGIVEMYRIFGGAGNPIPTKERLEYINSLCVIKDKKYNTLRLRNAHLVKDSESGDIMPHLYNGKILNITANVQSIEINELLDGVAITNVPVGAIVIPDSATSIDVTDCFKGCTAHKDMTDISQAFVYNGTATIDYASSGLQLVQSKTFALNLKRFIGEGDINLEVETPLEKKNFKEITAENSEDGKVYVNCLDGGMIKITFNTSGPNMPKLYGEWIMRKENGSVEVKYVTKDTTSFTWDNASECALFEPDNRSAYAIKYLYTNTDPDGVGATTQTISLMGIIHQEYLKKYGDVFGDDFDELSYGYAPDGYNKPASGDGRWCVPSIIGRMDFTGLIGTSSRYREPGDLVITRDTYVLQEIYWNPGALLPDIDGPSQEYKTILVRRPPENAQIIVSLFKDTPNNYIDPPTDPDEPEDLDGTIFNISKYFKNNPDVNIAPLYYMSTKGDVSNIFLSVGTTITKMKFKTVSGCSVIINDQIVICDGTENILSKVSADLTKFNDYMSPMIMSFTEQSAADWVVNLKDNYEDLSYLSSYYSLTYTKLNYVTDTVNVFLGSKFKFIIRDYRRSYHDGNDLNGVQIDESQGIERDTSRYDREWCYWSRYEYDAIEVKLISALYDPPRDTLGLHKFDLEFPNGLIATLNINITDDEAHRYDCNIFDANPPYGGYHRFIVTGHPYHKYNVWKKAGEYIDLSDESKDIPGARLADGYTFVGFEMDGQTITDRYIMMLYEDITIDLSFEKDDAGVNPDPPVDPENPGGGGSQHSPGGATF